MLAKEREVTTSLPNWVGISKIYKNTTMKEKDKNEIISRRQFFKRAAGAALPFLAMTTLPSALTSCEIDDEENPFAGGTGGNGTSSSGCTHCGGKCTSSCANNCVGNCRVTCKSGCKLLCKFTCGTSTCKNECYSSCKGYCYNSCKGSCSSSSTGGSY